MEIITMLANSTDFFDHISSVDVMHKFTKYFIESQTFKNYRYGFI